MCYCFYILFFVFLLFIINIYIETNVLSVFILLSINRNLIEGRPQMAEKQLIKQVFVSGL